MTKTIVINGKKRKCRKLENQEIRKATDVYSEGLRVSLSSVGKPEGESGYHAYRPVASPRAKPFASFSTGPKSVKAWGVLWYGMELCQVTCANRQQAKEKCGTVKAHKPVRVLITLAPKEKK